MPVLPVVSNFEA